LSESFLEFNFPCKECIVRAACKDKPKNEAIKHLYDVNDILCLTLPKFPSKIAYHKGLIECWANIGVSIINNMKKSEDPKTSRETHNNVPMQYVMLLGKISYLLQWIVNSTSWEKGELKDFDQREVSMKCDSIRF
jgi:hypothetical protein